MDRDERVARGDHDRIGSLDRLDHSRGRAGRVRTVVAQRIDVVLVASGDEPLLKRERPRGRDDVRPEAIVRRGDQPRLDVRSASEPGRDGGQRLAAAQRLRAHEMESEIAVAEHEPPLAAPRARRFERLPRLTGAAPAPLGVIEAGDCVQHRVEVGRDVQAEHLEIVADVPDHGELAGREHVVKTGRKLRATDAAREADDPHDVGTRRSSS